MGPNWDYNIGLRSKEQVEEWKRNCPIKKFEEFLVKQNLLSESEMKEICNNAEREVEEAVKFAEESPYPDPSEVLDDVFKM